MYYNNAKRGAVVRYHEDPAKILLILTDKDENFEFEALIVGTDDIVSISQRIRELVLT
jgi:hypothetical protein